MKPVEDVSISSFVTEHNAHRCVSLRGIPFESDKTEVMEFFAQFKKVGDSDLIMETRNGKTTGRGLVFLENEDEVEEAINALNRKYIKTRYIEVGAIKLRDD